jgi:hypothetical protein
MKTLLSQKTLWIISIVFILATFTYIGIQHRRINHLSDTNQLQSVELSVLNDSVFVYQNKAGELTYKLSVVEVEHSNLKESLDKAGFEIKKLKENDINWRKVNAALKLELEAAGHGETTVTDTFRIEKTDTVYFQKVDDWSNNYLSLWNAKIETGKLFFDYRYKTGVSIIPETKRRETIVNVFLTDPNASITTANSITVKHKTRWYEKPWLWGLAGLGTGILISK